MEGTVPHAWKATTIIGNGEDVTKELDKYNRVILYPNQGPNRATRRHSRGSGVSKHRKAVLFGDGKEQPIRKVEYLTTKSNQKYAYRKPVEHDD